MLEKLLKYNPAAIGITFFFGDNISNTITDSTNLGVFHDPRVVWLSSVYQSDKALLPYFALNELQNYGNGDLIKDDDSKVRTFFTSHNSQITHMSLQLAKRLLSNKLLPIDEQSTFKKIINFRGDDKVFSSIRLSEVLSDQTPKSDIEGKIIIIGAETSDLNLYSTPVGNLNRSTIIAHVTDNMINSRWIKRLPNFVYGIELLLILIFSVFIISHYPQNVALVFIFIFIGIITTVSIWLFDTFYFWTPVFSPIIQLTSTWIIFVGYIINQIEKKNWHLAQESKNYSELEQLKNNFISLISHDLKTPIAKIQAIVDRLLTTEIPPHLNDDLKALRNSSNELHKYIQSILRVMRVESRDFKIHKDVTDINELIVSAILQLKPLAQEKNIIINTFLEPLFSIEVDITLIQEVLVNLIDNAIKYTPANGVVNIYSQEAENEIVVQIKDTGEGINPNEIENVFGKFVRGSNQDLKSKGTGLGLYLVKYFVELHGGKIKIESALKQGTTVTISLPTQQLHME